MEELIRMIVMRMETELVEPDKVIISKYQEGTDLFIISKGECIVLILDEQSQQSQVKLQDNKNSSKKQKGRFCLCGRKNGD